MNTFSKVLTGSLLALSINTAFAEGGSNTTPRRSSTP